MGQSLVQHISDYSLALLMLAVLTFVPTSSIVYLVQERTSQEKLVSAPSPDDPMPSQVQRSFSVGPFTYWIASLLWDSAVSITFLVVAAIIIQAFQVGTSLLQVLLPRQVRSYTAGENFPATILLMFLFCLASNCFIYLAEKAFTEPSMGQIILLASFIFFGLITLVLMLLLMMFWWISALQDARKVLEVVLLLFPPYALGGGFLSLATAQIKADLFLEFANTGEAPFAIESPFSWDIVGKNLVVLGVEAVIFFVANLIWETVKDNRRPQEEEHLDEGNQRPVLRISGVTKLYRNLMSR
jgi:hypothetical protein